MTELIIAVAIVASFTLGLFTYELLDKYYFKKAPAITTKTLLVHERFPELLYWTEGDVLETLRGAELRLNYFMCRCFYNGQNITFKSLLEDGILVQHHLALQKIPIDGISKFTNTRAKTEMLLAEANSAANSAYREQLTAFAESRKAIGA